MRMLMLASAYSYLLGSIPFGYILVRTFRGEDVRLLGSGNTGATNVSRSSPSLGLLTLVLDASKGGLAVALTRHFCPRSTLLPVVAAVLAILGHIHAGVAEVPRRQRGGDGIGIVSPPRPEGHPDPDRHLRRNRFLSRHVSLASIVSVGAFPPLAGVARRLPEFSRQSGAHGGGGDADHLRTSLESCSLVVGNRTCHCMEAKMSRIAIIGAGAWGTTLSIVLGSNRAHLVRLWAHEPEVVESIRSRQAPMTSSFPAPRFRNRSSAPDSLEHALFRCRNRRQRGAFGHTAAGCLSGCDPTCDPKCCS
jgi:glycerol-3-phosphate acyltransferase PlsY